MIWLRTHNIQAHAIWNIDNGKLGRKLTGKHKVICQLGPLKQVLTTIRCSHDARDTVKRELASLRASYSHLSNSDWKSFAESKLEADGDHFEVSVDDLKYTQENTERRFKDSRTLDELPHALDADEIDPLDHPNMRLEVVRKILRSLFPDNLHLIVITF